MLQWTGGGGYIWLIESRYNATAASSFSLQAKSTQKWSFYCRRVT